MALIVYSISEKRCDIEFLFSWQIDPHELSVVGGLYLVYQKMPLEGAMGGFIEARNRENDDFTQFYATKI